MGTGHHAAVAAKVGRGKTVAVVGDGAVGLCGVIAAKRLGAEQIILLGNNAERIALGQELGATDVVRERGEEAVERVRELTGGLGAHSVLECVGLEQAVVTALGSHAPGRGHRPRRRARARHDADRHRLLEERERRRRPRPGARLHRGAAPGRPGRPDRAGSRLRPRRRLDEVPDGYRAMNDREAIKVMVRP